jgi:MycE methyltransferase N-terminal
VKTRQVDFQTTDGQAAADRAAGGGARTRRDPVEELIDLVETAGGRLPLGALLAFGPELAAEAVLAQAAGRARLLAGPGSPVAVQLELEVGDGRQLDYLVTAGPDGFTAVAGRAQDPAAVIRQDLGELVCAVFGPPGRAAATREVTTRQPSAPPDFAADDPAAAAQALAVAATHQLLAALGPRQGRRSDPGGDLTALAVRFGSDKWGSHWYTPHYDRYFGPMREERVTLLEIGIGGYHMPDQGGASLRMWKHYFRRGTVHGLDVYDKQGIDEPRLHTHRGDQGDPAYLRRLAEEIGPLDIVIDDGSHLNEHVLVSFAALFPHVRPGGLYVIEDTQTAYWPGWGGRDDAVGGAPGAARNSASTSMDLVKSLIDGLHHQERAGRGAPTPTDLTVTAVHVHHNLVVIEKGHNTEQGAPAWIPRDEDPRNWLIADAPESGAAE